MSVTFNYKALKTGFEALWPVTVYVPRDGGAHEAQTFVARLRHVPIDTLNETVEELKTKDGPFDYRAVPSLYFVGLGPDEDVTWSAQVRDDMLSVRWVREALERAYNEFCSGGAAAKN
jgi:hypothetical protein